MKWLDDMMMRRFHQLDCYEYILHYPVGWKEEWEENIPFYD